jgi:CheY-like chemotaxis protein
MHTLEATAEKPPTGESHRGLLAVGNVAEGDSLAGWLGDEGFDVMTATDGEEALLIARSSWQPDVVLLDPTLPGFDGSSVYE